MSKRKQTTERLTKKRIDALTYPHDPASRLTCYIPDHSVERLYLRILPSGSKRFVIRYY